MLTLLFKIIQNQVKCYSTKFGSFNNPQSCLSNFHVDKQSLKYIYTYIVPDMKGTEVQTLSII